MLKRKIRSEVESQLAHAVLRGDVGDGDKAALTYDASAHEVRVQKQSTGAQAPSAAAKEPAHA